MPRSAAVIARELDQCLDPTDLGGGDRSIGPCFYQRVLVDIHVPVANDDNVITK